MQSNFQNCLAFTLKFEGGKVNDPRDPGGRTNIGITQRVYDGWRRGRGLPTRSVYLINPAEYEDIYRNQYWLPAGCDALPAGVDLMAFDIAVNMGVGRVKPWLAQTANLTRGDQIRALDKLRCGFWRHLRTFPVFGKGWLARENACLALALKMDAAIKLA